MASFDEYMSALPPVTFKGQSSGLQREAVARSLADTRVPVEHVGLLSAIHTGVPVRAGAGALYDHQTRAMVIPGNPDAMAKMSPGLQARNGRTQVHEIGHAVAHNMNAAQFGKYLATPQGRGVLEAHGENYADRMLPGSYSGYDYDVSRGRAGFDSRSYQNERGQRYGNIDPRLR